MKEFEVTITETLEKKITVEALSKGPPPVSENIAKTAANPMAGRRFERFFLIFDNFTPP